MRPGALRLATALLPLLVALTATATAPTYAGDSTAAVAKRSDGSIRTQRVAVNWKGTQRKPRYQKRVSVPGIGTVALVCRPTSTMIRIYPYDTAAETQMWLAKYQDTDGDERADSVAVKNVRVYRYATAADNGKGGTGPSAHEGLNRRGRIENRNAGGYAHGIISQRPGRNRPAGGAATRPVTTFYLTWFWNGFDYGRPWQSCRMVLRTKTFAAGSLGVNWHGDEDANGHTSGSATLDTTTFTATCETGRRNVRNLRIAPTQSSVYVEEISGEGSIDDHVEGYTQPADDVEQAIDGIQIPRNGMLRFKYGGRWWLLSSYMVTNNTEHPELNVCEIAAAPSP